MVDNLIPRAGRIVVEADARLTTSELLLLAGDSLAGTGTIAGDVINAGTVQPGSSLGGLTIEGNYTQTADGTLEADITGTVPGIQYDQLHVIGRATLDRTLQLVRDDAFVPRQGDRFEVLTYGTRIFDFFDVAGRNAGPAQLFELAYEPALAVLSVVGTAGPDPVATRAALVATLGQLASQLPAVGAQFDLAAFGNSDLRVPFVGEALATTFGIGDALAGLSVPAIEAVTDSASLVQALADAGLEVLCVAGGAGGISECATADNAIQVRYVPDVGTLEGFVARDSRLVIPWRLRRTDTGQL